MNQNMKAISVIVAPALLVGIMFWCLWGHDLHMNVYSGDEFWHEETLSLQGKVLVSIFVGLSASAIVASCLVIRMALRKLRKHMSEAQMNFHEIVVISDGFTIATHNAPDWEALTIRWDAVADATAYKRDLVSTDQVCIAFNLLDGTGVEVHEEMKGWLDLCSAMPECLPGAPRWEQWFMNITTPAFETNMTPLFHRAPPSVAS